jgi:hypothetical protein
MVTKFGCPNAMCACALIFVSISPTKNDISEELQTPHWIKLHTEAYVNA